MTAQDKRPASDALPTTIAGGAGPIARQLGDAISAGAYAEGERLPAERRLAVHFGTSRSTVRDALRNLESAGLIERRQGSGTFVRWRERREQALVAEITSPLKLMEAREAIEPHLAHLAVAHATARSLAELEASLQAAEGVGADREAFSDADERFHLALAEATDNPLMVWIYRQINTVRGQKQWATMREKVLNRRNIEIYNRQHRAIFDAIRTRDGDLAVRLVREHLGKARRDLLDFIAP
jgi:DNA-binding FadR family transcriptional regulator